MSVSMPGLLGRRARGKDWLKGREWETIVGWCQDGGIEYVIIENDCGSVVSLLLEFLVMETHAAVAERIEEYSKKVIAAALA